MKILKKVGFLILLMVFGFNLCNADKYNLKAPDNKYNITVSGGISGEYGYEEGVNVLSGVTDQARGKEDFFDYAQDVVAYILLFVSLIGVIYIIYAGFKLMTSMGNAEEAGKTKTTIMLVAGGIIIMWLAYSIMKFYVELFG